MKRLFDLTCTVLGLLLLWPFLVVIAVLVKLTSPGPVFYLGVRTGLHGVPFRIFKFRTMCHDPENKGGLSTAKDDPRVTRVGRFLRRYKLDELPQLLNIIKGEMSIVGPRPEMPQYTCLYTGDEKLILTVRPGLTDYASIALINLGDILGNDQPDRKYEQEIRPKKNALRVKYVKEKSFIGDLSLIFRTILRMAGF